MSTDATVWAKAQRCRSQRAKLVLVLLAPYADAEGVAWAAKHVLAVEGGVDERTIQRGLAELRDRPGQDDGLIEATGDWHTYRGKRYPLYRLRLDRGPQNTRQRLREDAELGGTAVSPQEKARGDSLVRSRGDRGVQPRGDRAVSPTKKDPIEDKSKLTQDGCARANEAWLAMPEGSRIGCSSPDLFAVAWAAQVEAGGDEAAIAAACRAYARTPKAWGVSGKPVAAHRFIAEGRWKSFAGSTSAAGLAGGEASMPRFDGPPAVWAAFAEARGEAWCRSWLEPCRWDEAERALIAPKHLTFERIQQEGCTLRDLDIRIIAPSAPLEGTRA